MTPPKSAGHPVDEGAGAAAPQPSPKTAAVSRPVPVSDMVVGALVPLNAEASVDSLDVITVERSTRRVWVRGEGDSAPPTTQGFVYASCPACGTPQGEIPSAFCASCGQRLRFSRKNKASTEGVRCCECGFSSRAGSSTCVNCGMRL